MSFLNLALLVAFAPFLTSILPGAAVALETGEKLSEVMSREFLGDLDGMRDRGAIRVLVPLSQTFFFIDKGRMRGITAEFAHEFEVFANKELKTRKADAITVVMIPTPRDQIIAGIVEGRGDIAMANLTITEARRKNVDFSDPVYPDVRELVVTPANTLDLVDVKDLMGLEIHVRRSSSYFESLSRLNQQPEFAADPIRIVEVAESLEDEELLEMINADMLPATVVDSHKLAFWQNVFPDINVHEAVAIREGGDIAWAFRHDSPKLKALLNQYVAVAAKGTSIGNTLLRRYQQSDKWLKNIRAGGYADRLGTLRSAFEKYGEQYQIDWIILAALAFQESKFDQSARSRAGAVGIMQIKPSTARDPNVGIQDVSRMEDNIHAGTKYLRFIADVYFDGQGPDEFNRILMALASYNAGPNGIARVRKKSGNPDVWFGQLELEVAKSIGMEPLRYVSNIFRYYLIINGIVEKAGGAASERPGED